MLTGFVLCSFSTQMERRLHVFRFWSCLHSQQRHGATPHLAEYSRHNQHINNNGYKHVKKSVVGGRGTHDLKTLYRLSYGSRRLDKSNVIGFRSLGEMRPCGLQPIKMLQCRLSLQLHSSWLCRQTAQPYFKF